MAVRYIMRQTYPYNNIELGTFTTGNGRDHPDVNEAYRRLEYWTKYFAGKYKFQIEAEEY